MILLIDAGNTNTVAALTENGGDYQTYRFVTEKTENAVYYEKHLQCFVGDRTVTGVMISSVVPEIDSHLESVCKTLFGIAPRFVGHLPQTELIIRYDDPKKLGADLIAVAVGAVKKYASPVIVIDIGTATTFSVVNKKREYLGGLIAPGPGTSLKALSQMASQLPEIKPKSVKKTIGTNTRDCMRIGVMTGHAAMIDGMTARMTESLGEPEVKLVATGGLAPEIIPLCRQNIVYDKNLIFDGLYHLNKKA